MLLVPLEQPIGFASEADARQALAAVDVDGHARHELEPEAEHDEHDQHEAELRPRQPLPPHGVHAMEVARRAEPDRPLTRRAPPPWAPAP
jgi:hypothetical protein